MYTSCLRFALEMLGAVYKVQMTWNPSKNKVASLLTTHIRLRSLCAHFLRGTLFSPTLSIHSLQKRSTVWTQLERKILSKMKKRLSAKNFHHQQNIVIGFVKNPPAISKVIMQCLPHSSNVLSNDINAEDIRNYQSQHMTKDRKLCNS
ncbi:unnamed protein product [Sphagnum balticum]